MLHGIQPLPNARNQQTPELALTKPCLDVGNVQGCQNMVKVLAGADAGIDVAATADAGLKGQNGHNLMCEGHSVQTEEERIRSASY